MRPYSHLSLLGPGGADDALQSAGMLQGKFGMAWWDGEL